MKRASAFITTSITAIMAATLLSGCISDHEPRKKDLDFDTRKSLYENKEVNGYYFKQSKNEIKDISLNARNQWVHTVAQSIARQKGIALDKSFIPSKEYRITAKGRYSFDDALGVIRRQAEVDYIVDDGYLKIKNKDFINAHTVSNKGCGGKSGKPFSLSLKDAPLSRIFGYFIERKGYTIQYDLHYSDTIDAIPSISFNYRGCSVRDALSRIAKQTDLKITFKKGKEVIVRDYDMIKASVPSYYKVQFDSSSNAIGKAKQTGTRLSDSLDQAREFKSMLQTFMSPFGKAYLSNKGYIIVEDKPSYVKRIKKVLNKELMAQEGIDLSVTIVSVELKDNYKSGVDWQKVLDEGKIRFGTSSFTDNVEAFSLKYIPGGAGSPVTKALEVLGEYGKTKIVKKHHLTTKSGIIATLKAVEIIPYITETSTVQDGVAQVEKEAKSVESGIIMNIKPNVDGRQVNMNVDITVSEYLGDKEFSDGFKLPMMKTNNIQAPITSTLGETVLLTGISFSSDSIGFTGIPHGQRTGIASTLFGKNNDDISRTEYLIFITAKRKVR